MLDTCTVSRVTGTTTDEWGNVTPVTEQVYAGRCKVQTFLPQEQNPEAGGATLTVQRYSVHLPVARTTGDYAPLEGDIVTITASRMDPHLVGRTYRIVAPHFESTGTAYRVGVEES